MEVGDAVGAVVGGWQAVGLALFGPTGTGGGPDPERPELVEGEDPVREAFEHLLDTVELGVTLGIRGLLAGLRCVGR